jgi:hypothetical protein
MDCEDRDRWIDLGSHPTAGFGIGGVELSGYAAVRCYLV